MLLKRAVINKSRFPFLSIKLHTCSDTLQGGPRLYSGFYTSAGIKRPCLLWSLVFEAPIARKLPADSQFVSILQLGDLSSIVSEFHKVADLIFFKLADLLAVRGKLRLAGQKA
jgi:hypothetical protein